jgi:hypothetical protein
MVFTLLFGIATALMTLVLFNSSILANAKTRLQNAADAGAYSAGVLQARDHNFSAYLNRAMVANQVAVVQIASLKSYLQDAAATRRRMDGAVLSIEKLFPVRKPLWDFAEELPVGSVDSSFSAFAQPAVSGLDALIKAFETAQEANHVATAFNMAQVADETVKRNDSQAQLTQAAFTVGRTALQVKAWDDATRRHRANDPSPAADRFADVTVNSNSTDAFTRHRFSTPTARWDNQEVTWCKLLPNHYSSSTFFRFTHAGGSFLSSDKKRWLSLDATLGEGFLTCTFWYPCWSGICYSTTVLPLVDDNVVGGSGGAVVGRNGGYSDQTGYRNNPSSSNYYGNALTSPFTVVPAKLRYTQGPGTSLDTAGGLQNYYRDARDPTITPADQTPERNGGAYAVTIEAERTGATVRTSSTLLPGSDALRLDDGMRGDTLRALAAAQSYFYRSKVDGAGFTRSGWARSDGKTEVANLFSPYWQARLSDRSVADRSVSWAAQ